MPDELKNHNFDVYEIRIQGHLDTGWAELFYGMTISHQQDGTTTLRGPLADQVVLHSVLDRIRDMNLHLISVVQVTGELTKNYEDRGNVRRRRGK